jgi:hypothetical protein
MSTTKQKITLKNKKKSQLEQQYRDLFGEEDQTTMLDKNILVEPNPIKTYNTVVTYGAYDDPF